MRHIVLSDDGQNLARNAYHRLLAAMLFPESLRDQQQSLLISDIEKAEFDRVGAERYQPSEIMAASTKLVENRTAQLYLAGFVGFVFLWLAFTGRKPSLNRASIITSCAANTFGKVVWRPTFDPKAEFRSKAATSDPASLERIFRQYRGVAHICAARVAASEYLDAFHIWEDAPEFVNSLVQSCSLFQTTFENVAETKEWNLWDVKRHFPSSLKDWPPLALGEEIIQWVVRGHDLAIEQGLIKLRR